MKENTYSLYWIHYLEHQDVATQGYVGVTKNHPTLRFTSHRNGLENPMLGRAINKGAVQTLLFHNLSREEALAKELELRPSEKIGWNLARGGVIPSNENVNWGETKNCLRGENRTEKQKLASRVGAAKRKGQKSWNTGLSGFKQKPEDVEKRAAQLRGVPKKRVACPHCKVIGGYSNMVRWHFENCKYKV